MLPPDEKSQTSDSSGARRLTQLLSELGQQVIMRQNGESRTRDEALAELMWDAALGAISLGTDEDGGERYAKPDLRMALAILERREGKTPAAMPDRSDLLTAEDRISEIARASINNEADALEDFDDEEDEMSSESDADSD